MFKKPFGFAKIFLPLMFTYMTPIWFMTHSLRSYVLKELGVPKPCLLFLISYVLNAFSTNGGMQWRSGHWKRRVARHSPALQHLQESLLNWSSSYSQLPLWNLWLALLCIYLLGNILLSSYFSSVSGYAAKQKYYALCEKLRSIQFLPRKIITVCIEIGILRLG